MVAKHSITKTLGLTGMGSWRFFVSFSLDGCGGFLLFFPVDIVCCCSMGEQPTSNCFVSASAWEN